MRLVLLKQQPSQCFLTPRVALITGVLLKAGECVCLASGCAMAVLSNPDRLHRCGPERRHAFQGLAKPFGSLVPVEQAST